VSSGAARVQHIDVTGGPGLGQVDDGPVVEAVPLGVGLGRSCRARLGTFAARASARNFPAPVLTSAGQATAST